MEMDNRIIYIILSITIASSQGKAQWSSWARWSKCSVTCGHGTRFRKRHCDTGRNDNKECQGPAEIYSPCLRFTCPVTKKPSLCNCGCELKGQKGEIISSISSKASKACEWHINVAVGLKIELKINKLTLAAGFLRITSGNKEIQTVVKPGIGTKIPLIFKADTNQMTILLMAYSLSPDHANDNIVLEAEYKETGNAPKQRFVESRSNEKSPNVPAITGITACVVIIIIACVILAVRRCRGNNKESANEDERSPCAADDTSSRSMQTNMKGDKISHGKPMTPILGRSEQMSTGKLNGNRAELRNGRDSAYESEVQKLSHEDNILNDENYTKYYRFQPEYYVKVANIVHDPKGSYHIPEQRTVNYNHDPNLTVQDGSLYNERVQIHDRIKL